MRHPQAVVIHQSFRSGSTDDPVCSFCGRKRSDGKRRFIAGPDGVYICDEASICALKSWRRSSATSAVLAEGAVREPLRVPGRVASSCALPVGVASHSTSRRTRRCVKASARTVRQRAWSPGSVTNVRGRTTS